MDRTFGDWPDVYSLEIDDAHEGAELTVAWSGYPVHTLTVRNSPKGPAIDWHDIQAPLSEENLWRFLFFDADDQLHEARR